MAKIKYDDILNCFKQDADMTFTGDLCNRLHNSGRNSFIRPATANRFPIIHVIDMAGLSIQIIDEKLNKWTDGINGGVF